MTAPTTPKHVKIYSSTNHCHHIEVALRVRSKPVL